MFKEINGVLMNMNNIDKIEKSKEIDEDSETYILIYYSAKSQGLIKERFKSEKARDAKYDEFKGVKKGLLG